MLKHLVELKWLPHLIFE